MKNNYYNTVYIYWTVVVFFFINCQSAQCDSRGVFGWEAVDALAGYLVCLNRTITALSSQEEADIVQLYMALHAMDKVPSKYSQKVKKKTCQDLGEHPGSGVALLQDSRQQRGNLTIWSVTSV